MFGGPTMGTTYHVRLAAEPASIEIARLKSEVESLLAEVDRQMSTYRPDSELSRFNRAPAGDWFPVSSSTAEVAAAAQEISETTGGALDVTVGPLVRLWHFGPRDKGSPHTNQVFEPPSNKALKDAREVVGYRKLAVRTDPPALKKDVTQLEVDLSSIAPGYTVDGMADLLVQHGINDFMVEIGGEVRAAGHRTDGKPWRVAIERPLADRREMLMAVPLSGAAISTAGDYRKFFEHGGRRYSHIIDPATGRPVEHSLASVTVVGGTCLAADGWDTTLLVLGPDRGYAFAKKHGIAALFITYGDGQDAVRTTPAWQRRFGR
jgi:thiamine biosynthesis lipoprotein